MDTRDALQALQQELGPRGFVPGADTEERYLVDIKGTRGALPLAVLRPASTEQVSRALAICHAAGIPVVTQGGRTGLVQSHVPCQGEVVLSMERMNAIENIDADAAMATVQGGVVLQALQERLDAAGLMFPLDLGARGSCTVGGNISTNAGGNRVIRYGMTRELVVGLEAVLADGTVLDGLKPLIKNNTGIDLKHLFIGSEGILGVVTRAVLRLVPKPGERTVALCALGEFAQVRALLRQARQRLGGELTAFEVMWDSYFSRALGIVGKAAPLPPGQPYYALIETSSAGTGGAANLEGLLQLVLEDGTVSDAVIAKSGAENEALWKLRDISVEVSRTLMPAVPFDVSLPIAAMEHFVPRFEAAVRAIDPRCDTVVYGHLGDGNLHLAVHQPPDQPATFQAIQEAVYRLVGEYHGSISAEHGIGVSKREFLPHSRSAQEIAAMHALKNALDPGHLLNRGRVLAHRPA
ncbi:FAD-binding oxidoreductase [Ramlibacter sp.]|uniref:FAD-binding oxidoreductase n=1 Tax=Ramlibacter sp. TaxID=1917967 RepID=UPI002CE1E349|nr:FAD-binding oxidoreductase [Ramlibacter sp.]HWI80780.1 FAD-binding oxidoreductase [Ramlibacter sp.]